MFKFYTQKKIQQKTQPLQKQIDSLKDELQNLSQKFSKAEIYFVALYNLNQRILTARDLKSFLKECADLLSTVMSVENSVIMLAHDEIFSVAESKGLDADSLKKIRVNSKNEILRLAREAKYPITTEELKEKLAIEKREDFDSFADIKSAMLAPLLFNDQLIGIISLGQEKAKTEFSKFSKGELELFHTLSNQIAIVISNKQLFTKSIKLDNELRDKVSELTALFGMSEIISSGLSIGRLKEAMMDVFLEFTASEKGVFFIRDDEEVKLVPEIFKNISKEALKNIEFEIESDFVKQLLKKREPSVAVPSQIMEFLNLYQCNPLISKRLAELGLVLYIPFIAQDRITALLALGKKTSGGDFLPYELELFYILSSYAAITIDNTKLFATALRDGLTKAFTHGYFQQKLDYEINAGLSYRNRRILSFIMADIDHFKKINDTHGHQIGDKILLDVARIIMANVRVMDTVARYGGEEFAVILPESDLEEAAIVAENIRKAVETYTFLPNELRLRVTVSLGVATYPNFAKTKDELINMADKALYISKEGGRNKTTLCNAIN